jgi:hypothetical protein
MHLEAARLDAPEDEEDNIEANIPLGFVGRDCLFRVRAIADSREIARQRKQRGT